MEATPTPDPASQASSSTALAPVLLIGEHELTIDEKNRLLIPAEHRRALSPDERDETNDEDKKGAKGRRRTGRTTADAGEFIATIGVNRRPWLYPKAHYEFIARQFRMSATPVDDEHRMKLMLFARATKIAPDRQGRLLLPDKMLQRTGIGREVTLIGVHDHLEVWDRQDWEDEQDRLLDEMAETARREQARQGQQRGGTTTQGPPPAFGF